MPLWSGATIDAPDAEKVSELRAARGWGDDELVLMYSGNMGLGHLFDEVLEVAKKKAESGKWKVEMEEGMGKMEDGRWKMEDGKLKMEDGRWKMEDGKLKMEDGRWKMEDGEVRFVFYGGGKRRGEIEQFVATHGDAAVELHDYVAQEDLDVHLASADVHLVSLRPDWDGTMVPSKLQGVFAIGRPVIFIGSERAR